MGFMKKKNSKKRRKHKGKSKPFAAVEIGTVTSDAWKQLNSTEAHLYTSLKTFYRGNGQKFRAPFSALKERTRIKHPGTISKAIASLEVKEWISVTRYGKHGHGKGLRVKANEYELTFLYDYFRW